MAAWRCRDEPSPPRSCRHCSLLVATAIAAGRLHVEPARIERAGARDVSSRYSDGCGSDGVAGGSCDRGLALTVARPRASTALDTDRIAVVPEPSRFDYYSDVRWAEAAPQMLQQNLVAALEASGRFAGVFAAPARAPAELLLDVELRHFEAVAASADATPAAFVQVQANLVDSRRAVRVASFVSEARVPAADNRRRSVVAAFEQASARVIADVVTRVGDAAAAPTPTAQGQ